MGGTSAPEFLELAGEISLLFVAKTSRSFLDGGAITQEFDGLMLPLFCQPCAGILVHLLEEVAAQGIRRYATQLRQRGGRPISLPREFRPILDLLEFVVHAGSFSVMSILQCGQGIFAPMAWDGNSMCSWQKVQAIFRNVGLRKVIVF